MISCPGKGKLGDIYETGCTGSTGCRMNVHSLLKYSLSGDSTAARSQSSDIRWCDTETASRISSSSGTGTSICDRKSACDAGSNVGGSVECGGGSGSQVSADRSSCGKLRGRSSGSARRKSPNVRSSDAEVGSSASCCGGTGSAMGDGESACDSGSDVTRAVKRGRCGGSQIRLNRSGRSQLRGSRCGTGGRKLIAQSRIDDLVLNRIRRCRT